MSWFFSLVFILFMIFFVTQFTIPWIVGTKTLPLFRHIVLHEDDFLVEVATDHLDQLTADAEISTGVDKLVADYRINKIKDQFTDLSQKRE